MTFDAQLLFLGTELIKLRQEQDRAARIAAQDTAEMLNGQIVVESYEPDPATIPDGTGDSRDPERSDDSETPK